MTTLSVVATPTEADTIAELAAMDAVAFDRVKVAKAKELGVSVTALVNRVKQARREAKAPPLTGAARQAELERLADLKEKDPLAYGQQRKAAAEGIGCGVTALDKAVDKIIKDRVAKRLRDKPPTRDTAEVTALIDEFNAKYFVVKEAGKVVIYEPAHDLFLNRSYHERMGFPDFQRLYLNRTVKTGVDKNGVPIHERVANVWLEHRNRKQFVGGLVFDPSGRKYPADVLNLWQDFAVTAKPGSWELLKEHTRSIICNGNDDHFCYTLDWLADLVQNPARQAEVAIVLCGPEGCGKGFLARAVRYLCGRHGFVISNPAHLTGRFNAHMRDCIFLFSDEAFFAGNPAHIGVLKSLITEPHITVEGKFRDAIMVANFLHIMLASNEPWVVAASPESRRYCVFNVSEKRRNDTDYFAAIQHELDHGGYEAMLYELRSRKITCDLRHVPVTEALIGQRIRSLDVTMGWWVDCLTRGYVFESEKGLEEHFQEWLNPISNELLYKSYAEYCRVHHERHPLIREMLGKWLRAKAGCKFTQPSRLVVGEHMAEVTTTNTDHAGRTSSHTSRAPERVWKDRAPGYLVGTLDDARAAFLQATGLTVEWPEDRPKDQPEDQQAP